ncbi:hypothetical protein [Marinobacterium lacunae]|uniref:hypothetical protein n=1 Tax=Marinobacterium lacunae TaxID=1232683 RepID=UPI0012DE407A|nr:hypothetical protein [Marinobacterium lacunae]
MKIFSKETRRNVIVFFVGPLFMVPAVLLGILIINFLKGDLSDLGGTVAFGLVASIIGLFWFAYPLTLVLGLPAIRFLCRLNYLNPFSLAMVSLLGALIVTVIVDDMSLWVFSIFGYCSIAVSSGCWYVYKKCEKL